MTDSLPSELDFDPHAGDLDAQCAWRNFGGLTLDDACEKFDEAPEVYQEDFMFMGGRAFAFYYPVIDQFLRKSALIPAVQRGDRQAWILPQCIRHQFEWNPHQSVLELRESVLELCRFMSENLGVFEDDWWDVQDIEVQWCRLEKFLRTL